MHQYLQSVTATEESKSIIVKSGNRTIGSTKKMKCFLYFVHSSSHCLFLLFSLSLLLSSPSPFFLSHHLPSLCWLAYIFMMRQTLKNKQSHSVSRSHTLSKSCVSVCICIMWKLSFSVCVMVLNMWWQLNFSVMPMKWLSYTPNCWGLWAPFIFDHNSSVSKR